MSEYIRKFIDVGKTEVAIAGGKGANLGEMTRAGIPVPKGLILTSSAYRLFMRENGLENAEGIGAEYDLAQLRKEIKNASIPQKLEEEILKETASLWPDMKQVRLAVRSSATAEDLADVSFAGQQETYLNVRGEDHLLHRIRDCYASLWGERAAAYRREHGYKDADMAIAVVIQEMVESEKSGVVFTVNPVTQDSAEMEIDASYGLGEAVVSGKVTPDSYYCGKDGTLKRAVIGEKALQIVYADGETSGEDAKTGREGAETMELPVPEALRSVQALNEEEIKKLSAEAVRIEEHYGKPMDIEWAIRGGEVYILQARPITTLPAAASADEDMEAEIARYTAKTKTSGALRENLSFLLEKIPEAYYPLDSKMLEAINIQKSVIFSEAGLEISMQPVIDEDGVMVLPDNGKRITKKIRNFVPMLRELMDSEKCRREYDTRIAALKEKIAKVTARRPETCSVRECGELVEEGYQIVCELAYVRFKYALFASPFAARKEMHQLKKIDAGLTDYDLYRDLDYKTAVILRDVNALAAMIRAENENVGSVRKLVLSGASYEKVYEAASSSLRANLDRFFAQNGYKSDFNCYCLKARSLKEEPDRLINMLRPLVASEDISGEKAESFDSLMTRFRNLVGEKKYPEMRRHIDNFRYFHVCREESQYLWETMFYHIRQLVHRSAFLLAGDPDYENNAACLFLDEYLDACRRGSLSDTDLEKISRRKAKRPLAIKVWEREKTKVFSQSGDVLRGVSGAKGTVIGPVCVVHGPEEFYKLKKGDVLVCELTDPEWTPLFPLASAVVADTGAALSHAAIVAREYGMPAVLGVGNGTRELRDGDMVRVDGDKGRVEKVS